MDFTYEEGLKAVYKLQERQSVRSYEDRPIDEELLENILKVGLRGASGGNIQPFTIILERDPERRQQLCNYCGKQQFSAQAPVNLILLIDWHKMDVYAKHRNAPYVAPRSYKHYLTALEDAMCALQSIESAAWLCGVGSCYLFSSNYAGREIKEMYNLPKHTYPVLLMSMGYIKSLTPLKPKMSRDMMICESTYDLTDEQIIKEIGDMYSHRKMILPEAGDARDTILAKFKQALETTFDEDRIGEILAEVVKVGYINDAQTRFGMKYHAKGIYDKGYDVMKMMEEQELNPWDALK